MTRSCARLNLAADTIFMALVICCVFLTDLMRRRMSKRLAMSVHHREAVKDSSQGKRSAAPGTLSKTFIRTLKGCKEFFNSKLGCAPSGRGSYYRSDPGAALRLPLATLCCPFGANCPGSKLQPPLASAQPKRP